MCGWLEIWRVKLISIQVVVEVGVELGNKVILWEVSLKNSEHSIKRLGMALRTILEHFSSYLRWDREHYCQNPNLSLTQAQTAVGFKSNYAQPAHTGGIN